jgi:anti-anti-sigma factor
MPTNTLDSAHASAAAGAAAVLIESRRRNGVQVFDIKNDLNVFSSFDRLTGLVEEAFAGGLSHIALCFTKGSYLNTRLISHLVQYLTMAEDHGGTLSLVRPNQEIVNVLEMIGLAHLIRRYDSEDDLGVRE